MNWTNEVRSRLARHTAAPDEDVVLEIAQHAQAAWSERVAEDVPADQATAEVRALVENWCRNPALARRPRRPAAIEPPRNESGTAIGLLHDVRYGLRVLRRQPGGAALGILVTALGIGAVATLFSLVYGVLLRPLPWPDADRLALVTETREGQTRVIPNVTSNATYLAWRDQPATVESLAAFTQGSATVTGGGEAERVSIVSTTASLFATLRAAPVMGAVFTADDELPSNPRVLVISYGLWQRRFGSRSDIVGQSMDLDGVPYRIVGVMPAAFYFPDPAGVAWRPFYIAPVLGKDPNARSVSLFGAIARLRPEATVEQASAEGTARSRTAPDLNMVGIAVFGTRGPATVRATPYLAAITADVKPALLVLFAAVGLLLAGAVANVAGMQLARAVARRREVAIRSALGASAGRLARQLLIENLIVGLAGGLAGLLLTSALHRVLPSILPADFPRLQDVAVDWRVATLALVGAVAASLLFGSLPASLARRLNLVEALTEDNLAPVGASLRTRVSRTRSIIMVGQVAVAALLLVGAALLTRSFVSLLVVDRGFVPHNLLTAQLPLPSRMFTSQRRAALVDQLLDRLRTVPGVTHAAATGVLPLVAGDVMMSMQLPPGPGVREGVTGVQANLRVVSPDYLDALGVRLVDGRSFQSTDSLASERVAVVNRTFVQKYLSGSPFSVQLPLMNAHSYRVVGVVDDVRTSRVTDPPQPEIYMTYHQVDAGFETSTPAIIVRTTGDPAELTRTLRSLVREQDRSLAVQSVMTMDARIGTSLARPRLYSVLLGAFAGFALLVSGIGIFGVLSYSVAQRAREIGVRSALGATSRNITALVVRQGLGVTVWGIVVGLGAAFVLARQAGSLLYGVTASDPVSFAVVPIVLLAVAAIACYAPARRAARVDPLSVLKGQ